MPENRSEIILYQTEDGQSRIQVRLKGQTVWLTQAGMAELFQTTVANINIHIKNILKEGELVEQPTIKDYLIVRPEGSRRVQRAVKHYNLDMILAVGYRIRSHRGTQFRQWATERLGEYLVKGFTMDDERLKEGRTLGADYFDELLERIRDIRASEKRFYQKIRDIYTLAIDYDPNAEPTHEFFQIVQNKLHWAISGRTAAELIAQRADAAKPNMGLTSWKGAKVRRADVTVAKNYLNTKEISELNRIVVMYLDYAEDQAHRRQPLYMHDWRVKLDAFLRFNERKILDEPGKVSMEVAQSLALEQYEKFNQRRLLEEAAQADREFDEIAKRIESKAKDRKSLPSPQKKRRKHRKKNEGRK
ncbi:MAG: hydroxyacid dehydrogenase [Actinobacteria bacterium]|nr:hydroxyacid dehydrogenase [Actinomycetota bacterium]